MNFKKEYKKAFTDISASDDFKKQLEQELNHAASSKKRYTPYVGVLATAAALALVVGAVYSTGIFRDAQGMPDKKESLVAQENNGVENSTDIQIPSSLGADGGNKDIQGQSFAPSATWCDGVESDAAKYELFVELLSSEDVEAVYASETQGFEGVNPLEEAAVEELAEDCKDAIPVESATEDNVKYYKAVLKEGKNIIFQIWNEKYVRIAGVGTIYQIQE